MHIIEFKRGKDKKKRKKRRRRTEMGANVRAGIKTGAVVGGGLIGLHTLANAGTYNKMAKEMGRINGMGKLGTNIGRAAIGVGIADETGRRAFKYGAIGGGLAAGATYLRRNNRSTIGNIQADYDANKRYKKRKNKK